MSGPITTPPQALTMLRDYVAFHAPHGRECSSRIPYSPPRGFNRRECDCDLRVAMENAVIVGVSHNALVYHLTDMIALIRCHLPMPADAQFASVLQAEAALKTARGEA